MKIDADGWFEQVRRIESPNMGGPIVPELIVMHFTAGASGESSALHFSRPASGVSAHVVIDRDGAIIQCVPFNRQAWHAGSSEYGGRIRLNEWTVGVELANWGQVERLEDGSYQSWAKHTVDPAHVVRIGNTYWEWFPSEQVCSAYCVCKAITTWAREIGPGIRDVVGHSWVCVPSGRKPDPGPAFDMVAFRKLLGYHHAASRFQL